MNKQSETPGVSPILSATSWLFWITLCFGAFLALYTPYKLLLMGLSQTNGGALTFPALASFFLGTLSGVMGIRWCVLLVLSYIGISKHQTQASIPRNVRLPYVSILVPAHGEAPCIEDALSALVKLDYPAYEVIVVDDGSEDDTYQLALPFAGRHESDYGICDVKVFTKPNQGKWSAHNFGLRRASGTLILCIDADSRIEAGALRLMVRHMSDKRIGAVSGQIRVRNRGTLITLLQSLEYVLANGAMRLSQGVTGTVMIVPGPIGLFRREALQRVQSEANESDQSCESLAVRGPYSRLTFAEDFHLSLSMLSLGYRVVYEPHAVAHTKAPATIAGLISQRYRWNRGTMQVLSWYVRRVLKGTQSPFGLNLWILSTSLLDFYCIPVIYTFLLGSLIMFLLSGGSLALLAIWGAAACLTNIMSGHLYTIAHRDRTALLLLAPLFDCYQGILLHCAWLIATYDEIRGAGMRW